MEWIEPHYEPAIGGHHLPGQDGALSDNCGDLIEWVSQRLVGSWCRVDEQYRAYLVVQRRRVIGEGDVISSLRSRNP
jgi:hypothetical protein